MRRSYIVDTKNPANEIHVVESTDVETVQIGIVEDGVKVRDFPMTKEQFMEMCDLRYKIEFRKPIVKKVETSMEDLPDGF